MQELRNRITECDNFIHKMKVEFHQDCVSSVIGLCHVKDYIERNVFPRIEETKIQWEESVRANANGFLQDTEIKTLEDLIHRTCTTLVLLDSVIAKLLSCPTQFSNITERLTELKLQSNRLLKRLVAESLLIHQQPPQVLKKDTKFNINVSLASGMALNLGQCAPQTVRALILNETQLKSFKLAVAKNDTICLQNMILTIGCSGVLTGDRALLENIVKSTNSSFVASFNNLKLGKIDRGPDRRGAALEEKFSMLLFTEFTLKMSNEPLKLMAWIATLPVVVVVHDLQKCQAEGPIVWDNAFFEPKRQGFEIRQSVTWQELALHLKHKFRRMTSLDGHHRDLNEKQLQYLAQKLFSVNSPECNANTDNSTHEHKLPQSVTYDMLFKYNLPNRPFTLWEWFWQAAKTIKDDMREEWIDGLIHGFIAKCDVEELLGTCGNVGTFIIRFVDSQPGRICIHHLATRDDNTVYVRHPEPYSRAELSQKALSLRVRDSPLLLQLYPSRSKDEAFQMHWNREEEKAKKKNPIVCGYENRRQLDMVHERSAAEMSFNYMLINSVPNSPHDSQWNGGNVMQFLENMDCNMTTTDERNKSMINEFLPNVEIPYNFFNSSFTPTSVDADCVGNDAYRFNFIQ